MSRRRDLSARRRLSAAEWRWTLAAAGWLPPIVVALHLLGFQRSLALLDRLVPTFGGQPPRGSSGHDADAREAAAIARGVDIAARHGLVRPTCLGRSMGLWWLLRRRGLAAELRIGVRRADGDLAAHAWVEHRGQVLIDRPATVAPFVVLGGDQPAVAPPPADPDDGAGA